MSTVAMGSSAPGGQNCQSQGTERFAQTAAGTEQNAVFAGIQHTRKSERAVENIEAAEPVTARSLLRSVSFAEIRPGIAAGMYERTDGLPYNTIAVLDDRGRLRGTHRKRRLYDAFGYRESDECRAGKEPFSPIDTPAGKLGIITCFELRFPALAAEQKARGAETLFVPAGWVQGENKLLHWRTLLCARAIENGLTVLGADQYAPGKFVGHSMAFQPDGIALGELGEEQDLLIVKIN
ncbi:MAG: nitrilase-related carbon-nitrogen hydrolase [Butyricicoccus sp.]